MVRELFETMEQLRGKLEELLGVVQSKRKAIVQRNFEELEKCIAMEEKLLLEIKKIESRRLDFLKKHSGQSKLTTELVDKISKELASELPDRLSEHFFYLRGKIRELGGRITSVNEQNMYLVENSRQMLKMLFARLKGEKDSLIVNQKV